MASWHAGPTCLPSPLVVPFATSRRAISPSRPTVRYAGELAQSSRYARSWASNVHIVRAILFGSAACSGGLASRPRVGRDEPSPPRATPRPRAAFSPASGGSVRFCPSDRRSRCVHRPELDNRYQNIGLKILCDGIIERSGSDGTDTSDMRSHGLGRVLRAGAADRPRDVLAPREPIEHVARAPRDRQRHHPIERSVSCRSFPTTGRSASGGRSPSGGPRYGRSSRPRPAPMASRLRSRRPGSVCLARDRRGGSPAGNHGVVRQCS